MQGIRNTMITHRCAMTVELIILVQNFFSAVLNQVCIGISSCSMSNFHHGHHTFSDAKDVFFFLTHKNSEKMCACVTSYTCTM